MCIFKTRFTNCQFVRGQDGFVDCRGPPCCPEQLDPTSGKEVHEMSRVSYVSLLFNSGSTSRKHKHMTSLLASHHRCKLKTDMNVRLSSGVHESIAGAVGVGGG